MLHFEEVYDNNGNIKFIRCFTKAHKLLNTPEVNKGSAFTVKERKLFNLQGALPEKVESLEQQCKRMYEMYSLYETDLEKNIFLSALNDSNSTLFYALVSKHKVEMIPIIYTPTIGDAVENFSLQQRKSRGLYFNFNESADMSKVFDNRVNQNVDLVIVTDGEGVLGIGDQGVGGMDISIGKLMVYTVCAGINPNRVLPIVLDVGTDNEKLLKDPKYVGWRHKRVRGKKYDDFIDKFVRTLRKKLPGVYLHWEDFGRSNARKILNKYRDKIPTFNDDMQGTGIVASANVMTASAVANLKMKDHRVVLLGAGTAGCGVTDQICDVFVHSGISLDDARKQFWLIDRNGLLVKDQKGLVDFQEPYARDRSEVDSWKVKDKKNITLLDVVKHVKPTILIGCSTVHGAFNEKVVKSMYENCKLPIIMPLSNPTKLSEAEPSDLINWTEGKAIVATGSPFDPVKYKRRTIKIGQSNNAFVYPGLGLGVVISKAKKVSNAMIVVAAKTLSKFSPMRKNKDNPILPDFVDVQKIQIKVAVAVAAQARKEGLSGVQDSMDFSKEVEKHFWVPKYHPYVVGKNK
jgi:malate dehydrogenase (oxaloacetate-decarboxylating)